MSNTKSPLSESKERILKYYFEEINSVIFDFGVLPQSISLPIVRECFEKLLLEESIYAMRFVSPRLEKDLIFSASEDARPGYGRDEEYFWFAVDIASRLGVQDNFAACVTLEKAGIVPTEVWFDPEERSAYFYADSREVMEKFVDRLNAYLWVRTILWRRCD